MGNRVGGRCSPSPSPPPLANDEPIQLQSTPRRKNVGILELGGYVKDWFLTHSFRDGGRGFLFRNIFGCCTLPFFKKREDTLPRLGSIRTSLLSNARPPFLLEVLVPCMLPCLSRLIRGTRNGRILHSEFFTTTTYTTRTPDCPVKQK